jgi:hypothetical protein
LKDGLENLPDRRGHEIGGPFGIAANVVIVTSATAARTSAKMNSDQDVLGII